MPRLKVLSGPAEGEILEFEDSLLVGRGPLADLSLDDPMVSRRHAMLTWKDGHCYLSDLDSNNGTFLNNRRLREPTRLRPGDRVVVGTSVLQLVDDATSSPSPTGAQTGVQVVEGGAPEVLMTMAAEGPAEEPESPADVARQLRFLRTIGETLARTFDEEELLSLVLDRLMELLPQTERAFIMRWDPERDELVPHLARTREEGQTDDIATSRTLLDDVVRRREAVLLADSSGHERYSEADSLQAMRIRSAICVPILFRDDLFGVLQVDCTYDRDEYTRTDLSLLLGIASQLGMFLSHARLHSRLLDRELLERDLELARSIHRHFLPADPPAVPGHEIAFEYSPALAVGGDLFDFLELPDGRLGVAVGDVSGKGVSAALYVARLSGDIRYHSAGVSDPAEILGRVNRVLCESADSGMFVTLALLALEPESGEIRVASAGHPLPLIRRAGGGIEAAGPAGDPPLGVDPDRRFQRRAGALREADLVTLFTDGITEAENADRAMFGMERLQAALTDGDPGDSAAGALQRVLVAVKEFSGRAGQSDDITVVCLRRSPS